MERIHFEDFIQEKMDALLILLPLGCLDFFCSDTILSLTMMASGGIQKEAIVPSVRKRFS